MEVNGSPAATPAATQPAAQPAAPAASPAPVTAPQAAPAASQTSQLPFAAQAAPDTTTAPAAPAFDRSKYESFGVTLPDSVSSVDDVVAALAESNRQKQHALQFVASQMGGRPAEPPASAAPATPEAFDPAKHFASQWDVPAQDPQWQAMIQMGAVEKDQTGAYAPTPGNEFLAGSPVLAALNAYEFQYRQAVQGYMQNPYEKSYNALKPALQHDVQQLIRAELEQRFSQQQEATVTQQLLAQHDSQLFSGSVQDPYTGKVTRQLSPWGQQIQEIVNDLDRRSNGTMSQADTLQLAIQFAPPPQTQQPQADSPATTLPATAMSPVEAEPTGTQPFINRLADRAFDAAAHRPNGTGVITPGQHAVAPSNRRTMLSDAYKAAAGSN